MNEEQLNLPLEIVPPEGEKTNPLHAAADRLLEVALPMLAEAANAAGHAGSMVTMQTVVAVKVNGEETSVPVAVVVLLNPEAIGVVLEGDDNGSLVEVVKH